MKNILLIIMAVTMIISLIGCSDVSSGNGNTLSGGSGTSVTDNGKTNNNSGSSSTQSNKPAAKYELVGKPEMSYEYEIYLGYAVSIKGKLKNTSKKDFNYVSVTFAIFDEYGNQIDTALDNINYLQVGGTWAFNATPITYFEDEPSLFEFKLVDVTFF